MWESRADRVQHEGPETLWQQVADDIAAEISSGNLSAGARLPAELELSEIYGVARGTVRRAVKELLERELIVVVHGRGTFVSK